MKPFSTQQEILLVTSTSFSSRQLSINYDTYSNKHLDDIERLEEACVNGLLQETLPEICKTTDDAPKVYLWGITEGEAFLEFDFSEFPETKDAYFSIDPYTFISTKSAN
ncbi:MAG: hypothetical protein JST58_20580 [Bacteroidetes bacterium]|nr:hypothetical protein [Bacteroidota bacterium]